MGIPVKRSDVLFRHDTTRVIARFFMPRDRQRSTDIVQEVLDLPERQVNATLNTILKSFSHRHRNITNLFEKHYFRIMGVIRTGLESRISQNRQLLIGALFTREYSIEAAAFFNPSIVIDPDQEDLEEGETRAIISFRATGEGHISSIVFRNGIISRDHTLTLVPMNAFVDEYRLMHRDSYDRSQFIRKLREMDTPIEIIEQLVLTLPEEFTYQELYECVASCKKEKALSHTLEIAVNEMLWLADAYYTLEFSYDTSLSERVIFPISKNEKNGIEDARFVRFVDDDGSVIYYATFTAYDGHTILSKLLKTRDFYHFQICPLLGNGAKNKGVAIFPRKIDGRYAALSRFDGLHNYVMFSDSIDEWNAAVKLDTTPYPWELIQSGNCGSPIETSRGWLVLVHGVGAMRRYSIGAILLDLNDPTRVIARLPEPFIRPNEHERNGYVPNVVYTCGALLIGDTLIIPYGISDTASTSLTVSLTDLFAAMVPTGH
jgi:predicted GH43/DUF377 family glycosyl hydrolase